MRILVTGGHGFIGRHLVRGLVDRGYQVRVLDLQPRPEDLAQVEYDLVQGDVYDPEVLRRVWEPTPDVVLHLIGLADVSQAQEDPDRSFRLNVVSTQKLVEACRVQPVKQLVIPSTAAVYGITRCLPVKEETPTAPANIYGWHKRLAELEVQAYSHCYGVTYTILRLFNVYGRGHRGIIHQALVHGREGHKLTLFGVDQLRDFVYSGDVVEAFMRCVETPQAHNRILNIGSGEGMAISEVVDLVRAVYPGLAVGYRDGESDHLYDSIADIALAESLLGWSPQSPRTKMAEVLHKEMLEE